MRSLVLAVVMMLIPHVGTAHQSEDGHIACHKDAEGVVHCHVAEG